MKIKSFGYVNYSLSQSKCLDYGWKMNNKRWKVIRNISIKCKYCGHTIIPTKDRGICTHCGHWVYKNDKIEFKYKVLENLKMKEVR